MTAVSEQLNSQTETLRQRENLINSAIENWPYTFHPLRVKHQAAVNEQAARKFRSWAVNDGDIHQGGFKLFSDNSPEGPWLCGLRKLTWDTDFFGFQCGRIEPLLHPLKHTVTSAGLDKAKGLVAMAVNAAKAAGLEHLTASADPADALSIYALEESGFRLKDTMNYHFFDLSRSNLEPEALRARIAVPEDGPILEEFTVRAFGDRFYIANRFNSDPQYPREQIAQMYRTWVQKSMSGERSDVVMVVDYEGKPAAYLTGILPTAEDEELGIAFGDMGIGAVDPDFHKHGLFRIVHKELLLWFKERGIRFVQTRTALSTYGVNKNCSLHGSSIPCSPHTFHVDLRR